MPVHKSIQSIFEMIVFLALICKQKVHLRKYSHNLNYKAK